MIAVYILPTVAVLIFLYMIRNFNHWKNRGIPFLKPLPIFGNLKNVCLLKTNFGELLKSIYANNAKLPLMGIFVLDQPCLMINDLDLIRNVLIKDFDHFPNRTITDNVKSDPIGSNVLFIMKTPKWKDVRIKMTSALSSGKLKMMSRLMIDCGQQMVEYVRKRIDEDNVIEVRELCGKFTTETITSTFFGINAECFKYEDAPFRAISRKVYNWNDVWPAIQATCFFIAPKLVSLFRMQYIDSVSTNFLSDVFLDSLKQREKSGLIRNDLLDLLIEMKKKDQADRITSSDTAFYIAQATQFFIAGYETTSSTMSFLLMELAINQDIQEKVREEIYLLKKKYGEFSYECLREMEYLENTINETLRKYPIAPFLDRRCSKRYQIPGTDLVLEKGDMVYIPIMGIQYDPRYYPEPERFDPDRFKKENCAERHKMAFLPFGDGPRNCIGRRYALLDAKCGLAYLLLNFQVDLCEGSLDNYRINPKGWLLQPEHGIHLKVKRLNND